MQTYEQHLRHQVASAIAHHEGVTPMEGNHGGHILAVIGNTVAYAVTLDVRPSANPHVTVTTNGKMVIQAANEGIIKLRDVRFATLIGTGEVIDRLLDALHEISALALKEAAS